MQRLVLCCLESRACIAKTVVMHHLIPLESPGEWRDALNGIKHAFAHTWENCYAMYLSTGYTTYLYRYEADSVRVVCPLAEREFAGHLDIVTPYGFSGFVGSRNCSQFPSHWREFANSRGYVCGYIALNPLFENQSFSEPEDVHATNSLYFLDLMLSHDELLARLDRNRRRQLRAWDNSSGSVIFDRAILSEFFVSHFYNMLQRVGASLATYLSRPALEFLCSLDSTFLAGVKIDNRVESATMFTITPFSADALFHVALPEGRRHAVPLLWSAATYLKALNVPVLNLGGGIRDNDSLAQFKQRFGARRASFRSLKQVYRPDLYAALCREVNADSQNMLRYFPAYRDPACRPLNSLTTC